VTTCSEVVSFGFDDVVSPVGGAALGLVATSSACEEDGAVSAGFNGNAALEGLGLGIGIANAGAGWVVLVGTAACCVG
jgi:hypothetical protein